MRHNQCVFGTPVFLSVKKNALASLLVHSICFFICFSINYFNTSTQCFALAFEAGYLEAKVNAELLTSHTRQGQ